MTLSNLFARTEDSYPGFFRVYRSLTGYRASKKYKIPYLLSGRPFYLKKAKIAPEIEKKTFRFFKERIQASLPRKELAILLKAPEKMALQPEGAGVW